MSLLLILLVFWGIIKNVTIFVKIVNIFWKVIMAKSKTENKWIKSCERYVKDYEREIKSKKEWRRIKEAKANGIKNPYFNFVNNLPEGLSGLAKRVQA